ncbi:MAG TPA: sigma-70 family RNA polymerase sigma factor [Phycisphaerae bacterium]|jgi:RNA polymerase sigma factor (TIGR02999 family)
MADDSEQAVTTLTQVLDAARQGDRQAAADLLPLVYEELRSLARARMARLKPGETLQPTALVHEAYLRVVGSTDPGWDSRGHFFAAAAQAMRNILVDQARRKASLKHGGAGERYDLHDAELLIEPPSDDILALDEALTELERTDPRKARVVMLHHFGGLTLEETAATLGVSVPTVQREWRFTRALLFARLSERKDP